MLNFRKMILERPTLRRAVTRMLYGNQDSNVDLIGIHLHVNSVEESGYFRLDRFLKRSPSLTLHQEFPVIRHLAMILSPGDLFVDVGANVGLYSCALASMGNLFNDPDFAWAFEPHVAVGTPVTRRPPHRSGRARLTHPAPASSQNAKR